MKTNLELKLGDEVEIDEQIGTIIDMYDLRLVILTPENTLIDTDLEKITSIKSCEDNNES